VIFRWLKKRGESPTDADQNEPLLEPLAFSSEDFIEHVGLLFEHSDLPTIAMSLVAFENIKPMMSIFSAKAAELGKDYKIDDLIRTSVASMNRASDDIALRKPTWFYLGSLLYRGTQLTAKDPMLAKEFAKTWVMVTEASIYLRALLPDNRIWDEDEKIMFNTHYDDSDTEFITYVVNYCVPKSMNACPAFKELAEKHDCLFTSGRYPFLNPNL